MDRKTQKIVDIFKKISWLDKYRYNSESSEDEICSINLSSSDLTNSDKILTHFLCYISDRGMTYSQIWDKGGFVYSNIVKEYTDKKEIEYLLNPETDESFYREIDNGDNSSDVKYGFRSKITIPADKNNVLIKDYGLKESEHVSFISRYYPSDLKSMMQTLIILEKFDRNIIRYIAFVMNKLDGDASINKLGFSLYLLGYYGIGQPKRDEYKEIKNGAKENAKFILDILNNKDEFEKMFNKKWKSIKFNQKRVWCSLRDYAKSPEFKGYMIGGFKDIKEIELVDKWDKSLNLSELELPGDVWNNNPKFKKCLFGDMDYSEKKQDAPRFIRGVYEDFIEHIKDTGYPEMSGYPEMFDVTFDFVPRMCSKNLCDFCIFNENNKLSVLCTKDEKKYCPVILVSCGYYHDKCKIDGCPVVDNYKET